MIRYIRVLGAALGGLVGLALAAVQVETASCSATRDYAGAFLAAWVVAWIVVGFAILPYLTVVPGDLADRARSRTSRPPSSWPPSSACSSAS